ncbi:hypothetical protein M422DRAFT_62526 [Sphaerobolus stellatus SS14]|nr:hypothetical protein M422DRAFT_62526 [Sphaerobolus stellatus SS14]
MSYAAYGRRPQYSNAGYGNYGQDRYGQQTYGQTYPGEYGQGYDQNFNYSGYQGDYQQPVGYGTTPRRRYSHGSRHGSQIQVLPAGSQVYTSDGRQYGDGYYGGHRSSRRNPVVLSSGDAQYATRQPYTASSKYYASNQRGGQVPVIQCHRRDFHTVTKVLHFGSVSDVSSALVQGDRAATQAEQSMFEDGVLQPVAIKDIQQQIPEVEDTGPAPSTPSEARLNVASSPFVHDMTRRT